MRIDVLARMWGSPAGAANGMAQAVAFFAETLVKLGHDVRRLSQIADFSADLVISTIPQWWHRTSEAAIAAGARDRVVYWHHGGGVPAGQGCILAAPPSVELQPGWERQVVLPPSSWAAEQGGECIGSDVLVAGAGPAKGGHVALEVAKLCLDLTWYVLPSRSSQQDRDAWRVIPGAEVVQGIVEPQQLLGRARAVLAPTRFDVHPLLLVEAAVRGIPIVCTDMTATRHAAKDGAVYVAMNAPAEEWAAALRQALKFPMPRLKLRPYAEVVAEALVELVGARRAAA